MSNRSLPAKVKDLFSIIFIDPYRKSIPLIVWEYGRFLLTKPNIAEQYFSKFLYRKGVKNFDDYAITFKLRDQCLSLNHPVYNDILDDKYLFELFFKKHNLPVANTFARNSHSLFFMDDEMVQINTPEQFLVFVKDVCAKSKGSESIFIKKQSDSSGGKFIFKVSWQKLKENPKELEELFKSVLSSSFIFQEEVQQHEAISRINPFCVNSLRIESFTNKDNVSRVFSGILRLGFRDSYVDNTSMGGAFVGIDFQKGVLKRLALSDFSNGRARTYAEHPYSKITFEGYPIPYFDEIMELVIKASQLVPQVKVVGWDIAITPDGPMIIEGNRAPYLFSADVSQEGIGRSPVFQEMKKEALAKGSLSLKLVYWPK